MTLEDYLEERRAAHHLAPFIIHHRAAHNIHHYLIAHDTMFTLSLFYMILVMVTVTSTI